MASKGADAPPKKSVKKKASAAAANKSRSIATQLVQEVDIVETNVTDVSTSTTRMRLATRRSVSAEEQEEPSQQSATSDVFLLDPTKRLIDRARFYASYMEYFKNNSNLFPTKDDDVEEVSDLDWIARKILPTGDAQTAQAIFADSPQPSSKASSSFSSSSGLLLSYEDVLTFLSCLDIPPVANQEIDLYALFDAVMRRGGVGIVEERCLWDNVCRNLIDDDELATAEVQSQMAQMYNTYLHEFELSIKNSAVYDKDSVCGYFFDSQQADKRPLRRAVEEIYTPVVHSGGLCGGVFTDAMLDIENQSFYKLVRSADLYVCLRNHILREWESDVTIFLSMENATAEMPPMFKKLGEQVYQFLHIWGCINNGCLDNHSWPMPKQPSTQSAQRPSVLVIGAGMAGVCAAKQLVRLGYKVTVLEGRERVGGRIYTRKAAGFDKGVDTGASLITGVCGNPLDVLCKQTACGQYNVRDVCPLYIGVDTVVPTAQDARLESIHNTVLDLTTEFRSDAEMVENISLGKAVSMAKKKLVHDGVDLSYEDERILAWHLANLEYANCTDLKQLSLSYWDQDDELAFRGAHAFPIKGFSCMVDQLSDGLDIRFKQQVVKIAQCKDSASRVVVTTCPSRYTDDADDAHLIHSVGGVEQIYEADAVLVTVPLGALQRRSIVFDPPLPTRKQKAIDSLGFGNLEKVILKFPSMFWPADTDMFGRVPDSPDASVRGEFFLFWSLKNVVNIYDNDNDNDASGENVLIALLAGKSAATAQLKRDEELVENALKALRSIFPSEVVPEPTATMVTCWAEHPFTYGSYSYVKVGSRGAVDYDTVAAPIDNLIFFAGEGTIRQYPATVSGAFLSGLREAAHIHLSLCSSDIPFRRVMSDLTKVKKRRVFPWLRVTEERTQQRHSLTVSCSAESSSFSLTTTRNDESAAAVVVASSAKAATISASAGTSPKHVMVRHTSSVPSIKSSNSNGIGSLIAGQILSSLGTLGTICPSSPPSSPPSSLPSPAEDMSEQTNLTTAAVRVKPTPTIEDDDFFVEEPCFVTPPSPPILPTPPKPTPSSPFLVKPPSISRSNSNMSICPEQRAPIGSKSVVAVRSHPSYSPFTSTICEPSIGQEHKPIINDDSAMDISTTMEPRKRKRNLILDDSEEDESSPAKPVSAAVGPRIAAAKEAKVFSAATRMLTSQKVVQTQGKSSTGLIAVNSLSPTRSTCLVSPSVSPVSPVVVPAAAAAQPVRKTTAALITDAILRKPFLIDSPTVKSPPTTKRSKPNGTVTTIPTIVIDDDDEYKIPYSDEDDNLNWD